MEEWLTSIGLAERIPAFREQKIASDQLADLTEDDLRELGLTIGERRRFLRAVADRAVEEERPPSPSQASSAEHRPLTVMFADLIDSTGLGERLDPEDLLEVMRVYREFAGEAIARYGGHIARFLGDGILAYFCYPIANENDPERAVRAALDIVRGISALRTPAGSVLQVRIGLATGRVIVSDLFAGGAADPETIIGSCPNLAARLQSIAEPNGIIIAERTYERVATRFHCEALGMMNLRGFGQSHAVWKVIRERTVSDLDFPDKPSQSIFVGRDAELDLLQVLWRKAGRGEGSAVLITGEAGMGKSRLIDQFLQDHAQGSMQTICIAASAFDANSPLRPFADHLRASAGLLDSDDQPSARAKLERIFVGTPEQRQEAATILPSLLGLDSTDQGDTPLSPGQLRERTIKALIDQLLVLAAGPTLCMVVEDLHWLDPTSCELLELLIGQAHRRRILLLLTTRPDGPADWSVKADTTLRLAPLAPEHVTGMMHGLLGEDFIDRIVNNAVERTDGVPLFVEEVARALMEKHSGLDAGLSVDRSIPASLEESLMARLDRSGAAKEVAQAASVIGRSVRRDMLALVCGIQDSTLSETVATLVRIGILERVYGSGPETYNFHHALLRDAAYASLVRERRKDLHRRVAQALRTADPDGIAIYPEVLALHLTEGGLVEEATPHWIEAARRSLSRSALREATELLRRALAELERLPQTEMTRRLRVQVSALLGPVLISLNGASSPETQQHYNAAYELCSQLPQGPEQFPILWGWWRTSPYSPERAPALMLHAKALGDPGLVLEAHHCSWAVDFNLANFRACHEHMQAGLAIYDRGDYRHHASLYGNHDAKVCAHGNLSQLCWMEGKLRTALEEEARSLSWAENLGHLGTRVHALGLTLLHRVYRRDYREVFDRSAKLMEFTTEHGMADHGSAGLIFQGWVKAMQGDPETGLKMLEEGLRRQREVATDEDLSVYLSLLAEVLMHMGRPEDAIQRIECERPTLDKSNLWIWMPELLRTLGEATLAANPKAKKDAYRLFEEAAALSQKQGVPMLGLRIALSKARLDMESGRSKIAVDSVLSAIQQIPERDGSADFVEAYRFIERAREDGKTHPAS
jgi:class 3 adenylate cyclase/predicted ATPase